MWTYHLDLLDRAVPRYTSYPTAAEFGEGIDQADIARALAGVAREEPVSLYLHIPYCHEICWYCGCNTGSAARQGRLDAYVEALGSEIDLVATRLGGRGRVRRIAFGGGSPNALSSLQFVRLFDRLVTAFAASEVDVSIELDPRTLDRPWIDAVAGIGIRSASLGVQSFSPQIQAAIGRVQPVEMIAAATDALRGAGVTSLNFDLMYGLPGQDEAELERSIAAALALGPDRLAVFGYAHLPQMFSRQRRIDGATLPGAEARFRQAALAHDMLVGARYQPIGFDHFARPGDPLAVAARTGGLRRNFQGFTEDRCDTLIGLGASAISRLEGLLAQNEKAPGRYRMRLSADQLPVQRGIAIGAEDLRRGQMIERLLCDGRATIDPDIAIAAQHRIAPFVERGLARFDGGELAILPAGLPYARSIAATLDAYRATSAGAFSRAV